MHLYPRFTPETRIIKNLKAMRVIWKELLPYNGHSYAALRNLRTYYTAVVLYTLVLLALDLPLTRYSSRIDSHLHVCACVALGVVGTVCVLRCCQFSGRLLSTRGEWWNLWRRQAGTLGVRFVVLTATAPLAFGMLALYCLWRHAQHMAEENGQHVAEENGSRWHGALLSCTLTVPRIIEEAMITLLVVQVLPVTRQWADNLTSSQRQAAMALVWWQLLASAHNFTLATLHGSHAHYVGLYLGDPEYLLLVYDCLLLTWTLVLLVYVAGSMPTTMQQGTPVVAQELVPGTELVIDMDSYPPPMISLVGGVTLPAVNAAVGEEGTRGLGGVYGKGLPSLVEMRARRHSHTLLHKHLKYRHREFV